MRSLLIIFATLLLASCDAQQPASTTPSEKVAAVPDIRMEEISYKSGDVTLNGYMAWDAAKQGQRPGVLIVHEWWGHNDYVRQRARMLAELGYTAFALDMYGDGKLATHPDDAKKFMLEVLGNMESAKARFIAARELLEAHPSTDPEKTAAIGYCFGGGVVLHMARFGLDLDGVASFHGSLGTKTPAQPGAVKTKVLVLHGADDPFVPAEQVDGFKKEMADAGADMTFIAYPGAVHSFTRPDADAVGNKFGLPLAYNEAADKQSWAELQKFFNEIFK